jgi:hypothetical protein
MALLSASISSSVIYPAGFETSKRFTLKACVERCASMKGTRIVLPSMTQILGIMSFFDDTRSNDVAYGIKPSVAGIQKSRSRYPERELRKDALKPDPIFLRQIPHDKKV